MALYFLLPLRPDHPASYLWLFGGLLLVGVLVVWQVLQIMAADHPRLRAIEAMATTLPLYLILFSTVHYLLGQNQPGQLLPAVVPDGRALLRRHGVRHGRLR